MTNEEIDLKLDFLEDERLCLENEIKSFQLAIDLNTIFLSDSIQQVKDCDEAMKALAKKWRLNNLVEFCVTGKYPEHG